MLLRPPSRGAGAHHQGPAQRVAFNWMDQVAQLPALEDGAAQCSKASTSRNTSSPMFATEGAPDPPPHRRAGARAHLPVHARLLRRVAHEAWREHMFADTDQLASATRDPVAPATRSKAALAKAGRHTPDDGTPVHRFSTLMAELAIIVRCRTPHAGPMRRDSRSSPRPTRSNEATARVRPHLADPVVDGRGNSELTPSACRAKANSSTPGTSV
jgi:hypothetical protein